MIKRRWLLCCVALSIVACGGARAPAAECVRVASPKPSASNSATRAKLPKHVDELADEMVNWINAGDGQSVYASFGEDMAAAFPLEKTSSFIKEVSRTLGKIVASEREDDFGGKRDARYHLRGERDARLLEMHLGPDGKIVALRVGPLPQKDPPVARSAIALALPFRGTWLVVWGGDSPETNHHIAAKGQRRAADLDHIGADGKAFRGEGNKNEEYFAYGQEILAVADGTVTTVIDGVHDNVPGEQNPYSLTGNAVVVRHTDALYSVYGHLQSGKMRVKVGAKVKQGAVLGICGNSGNSTAPHLHFQLQDGPRMENAWGVEAVFSNVSITRGASSIDTAQYTFLKGDLVTPKSP